MVYYSKNMHIPVFKWERRVLLDTYFFPVLLNFIPQDDVMFSLYIKTYKRSGYNPMPNVSLTLGLF